MESDRSIIPVHETPVYNENKRENEDEAIDKSLLLIVPSINSQQLNGWRAEPSSRNMLSRFAPADLWQNITPN